MHVSCGYIGSATHRCLDLAWEFGHHLYEDHDGKFSEDLYENTALPGGKRDECHRFGKVMMKGVRKGVRESVRVNNC